MKSLHSAGPGLDGRFERYATVRHTGQIWPPSFVWKISRTHVVATMAQNVKFFEAPHAVQHRQHIGANPPCGTSVDQGCPLDLLWLCLDTKSEKQTESLVPPTHRRQRPSASMTVASHATHNIFPLPLHLEMPQPRRSCSHTWLNCRLVVATPSPTRASAR